MKPKLFDFYSAAGLQSITTANLVAGIWCSGVINGALVTVLLVAGNFSGEGFWLPNDNSVSGFTWQELT